MDLKETNATSTETTSAVLDAAADANAVAEAMIASGETPPVYERLGLRPVINAAATLTRLGGSIMPPEAIAAMAEAARCFIPLDELQIAVGKRIAELTKNEAAYVSSGAAAGIMLAVAACVAGTDPKQLDAFPYLEGIEKTEIVVHRSQRNGYDYAARQTGAKMVDIEGTEAALDAAINERTAGVLWFAGAHWATGALPIQDVVRIAHARGVPVIVDAAAQVPAVSNLWHFTREIGADVAIFSGGKGIRGPQSSGLVLGREAIIAGCRANGSPNHAIGRPMKVGKEEMIGLLAALEWTLAQDEAALLAGYEAIVQGWIAGLSDVPGVTVERGYPSEAGQPHGRTIVTILPESGWTRDQVIRALWEGDGTGPHIAVGTLAENERAIALNPQTLQPGEEHIVLDRLRAILTSTPTT